MTVEEALKKGFDTYYRQMMKYKNALKRPYRKKSKSAKRQNKLIKIGESLSKREVREVNPVGEEEKPSYIAELRLIFNDVLIEKYNKFEKAKEYKNRIQASSLVEVESSKELTEVEGESEYLPKIC